MPSSVSRCNADWWDELDHLPDYFRLVPCGGSKYPIDPVTGNGLQDWTHKGLTVQEFKALSRKYVRAAGLVLGPVSGGILAVDFDAPGHELIFSEVFTGKQVSDLPKTLSWKSGKPGRRQMAFRVPLEEWDWIRNRFSWKNESGETALEIRWKNVQSIILGAHPETEGYRWCDGCDPKQIEIADAPAWLIAPVKKHQRSNANFVDSDRRRDIDQAKKLLCLIHPRNSYDEWLRVGMALHSVDAHLLCDWIKWSKETDSFDEKECIEKWESFSAKNGGVTIGTLCYLAEQDQELNFVDGNQGRFLIQTAQRKLAVTEESSIMNAIDELIRLHSESRLNAQELMPEFLAENLSIIRSTVRYNWDILLVVLMTGLSGALPLESEIELIPGDFKQSLNLLTTLLMDTGEVKSPLIKRLISDPWKRSVDMLMELRYSQAVQSWKQLRDASKDADEQFEVPRPERVKTLITEDLTPQGVERHLVLHDFYAKGSVLLLFDEGKDLLSEMSGQTMNTNQLKLGTWILSRYDGSGARGAKADAAKERSYSQCRLSALICCQPDIYRQITGDSDQSGLAGRFIVVEQPTVHQDFPEEFPASHQQRHQQLADLLVALYAYASDRNSVRLVLSDPARRLFQMERRSLDNQKNQTLSDAARGQLNKAHGRLGRLAANLHLLWSFDSLKPESRDLPTVVGVHSMERAITLNRHLISTSVLARQTACGNNSSMQKIEAFQRRALKVKSYIKVSDIRRALQSSMRASTEETEMIVAALDQIGVGKLWRDERGILWYQALRSMG